MQPSIRPAPRVRKWRLRAESKDDTTSLAKEVSRCGAFLLILFKESGRTLSGGLLLAGINMAMRLGNQVPAARGLGNLIIGSTNREEGVMKLHRTMHSGIDDGE